MGLGCVSERLDLIVLAVFVLMTHHVVIFTFWMWFFTSEEELGGLEASSSPCLYSEEFAQCDGRTDEAFFTGFIVRPVMTVFFLFFFLIVERMKNSSHYFGIDFCLLWFSKPSGVFAVYDANAFGISSDCFSEVASREDCFGLCFAFLYFFLLLF